MSFLTGFRPTLRSSSSLLRPSTRLFSTTPTPALARITIVGRLADQPEVTPTSTGIDVIKYALGTSHGKGDNKTTSWWRVASFVPEGPLRDLTLSLGKGSQVYVEGDAAINKYTDREGNARSDLSIVQSESFSNFRALWFFGRVVGDRGANS